MFRFSFRPTGNFSHRVHSPRPACSVVISCAIFAACFVARAGAAQNATETPPEAPRQKSLSHEQLLAAASERPLQKPTTRKPDGQPLSDSELSEFREAEALQVSAIELRREGKYAEAKSKNSQAHDVFRKLVGPSHHQFVTTVSLAAGIEFILKASPELQQQLIEADKQAALADRENKAGRFAEARAAARSAIEHREKVLGKDSPELVEPLRILGNALTELRSFDEADRTLARALDIAERTYGKSHPRTAMVLDRIGWLRIYQSKPEEAIEVLRRAVFVLRSTVGETTETAEAMDNLGTALGIGQSADVKEATHQKLRALVIRQQLLGPDARETGISLSNLAWLYGRVGMQNEVIPLRRRALEIFEKTVGERHRDTLVEKSNLAQTYRATGQIEDAQRLYQAMTESDAKSDDRLDQGVLNRLMMLGMVQLELGKQQDGEKTLDKALEQAVRLYEMGEHTAAMNELDQLALAYQSRRMIGDAIKVRERILKLLASSTPRLDEASIRRTAMLGRLYVEAGRAKEGVELLSQSLTNARALYGDGERELLTTLLALAHAQLEANQLEDAQRTSTEIMMLVDQKFRRQSLNAGYALHLQAKVQLAQKSYDLAAFTLDEARTILDQTRNRDAVQYLSLLRDLSLCQSHLGEHEKAIETIREAIQITREMPSPYPMQTRTVRANSLKRLLEAMEMSSSGSTGDREPIIAELKENLVALRDAKALTGEMKRWLADYGISESRD